MAEIKNQATSPVKFEPYIKHHESVAEFTLRAVILGSILAIVFGVANAYLGLKVGMTVSASIPAAVISMAILRGILKNGTILENNISQTIGSSGESLAAGVIFTIPAFLILQIYIPSWKIIVISLLGGFLGILFMIPLRKYLIIKEHGKLPFPEGTACAEILVAGDEGGSKAKTVFAGVGIAAFYKFLMSGLKLWKENPVYNPSFLKGGTLSLDATPALMGVGYIIGPKISSYMFAGAVLGYLGIAPLIAFIGQFVNTPIPPATVPISELSPGGIRDYYIRYIGAGAVAIGGFISLIKAMPVIVSSFKLGFLEILQGFKHQEVAKIRTEREIPLTVVIIGSLVTALAIWALPGTNLGIIGSLAIIVFGFFFVTVAARIVGIVGSSSSPVSAMTIATILATSFIFVSLGITGTAGILAVLTVGSIICIAVCMSGDASQDLKTGYLVGSTPLYQQISEFIGVLVPAFFMSAVIMLLHKTYGLGPGGALEAPQASIIALVTKGVMTDVLPWVLVGTGVLIGLTIELLGIASLPVAIGMYLPVALSTPIMVGGLIYYFIHKTSPVNIFKQREEKGILYSSGLVAGDALVGVLIAFIIATPELLNWIAKLHPGDFLLRVLTFILSPIIAFVKWSTMQEEGFWHSGVWQDIIPLIAFAVIGWCLWRFSRK